MESEKRKGKVLSTGERVLVRCLDGRPMSYLAVRFGERPSKDKPYVVMLYGGLDQWIPCPVGRVYRWDDSLFGYMVAQWKHYGPCVSLDLAWEHGAECIVPENYDD